mmetsp:Transcript_42854/g.99127  ORF Transcript_42854/g.99127 Transcript_42854/m.99127 type:complete len:324 (-) Transcript_42854:262-1233(-)
MGSDSGSSRCSCCWGVHRRCSGFLVHSHSSGPRALCGHMLGRRSPRVHALWDCRLGCCRGLDRGDRRRSCSSSSCGRLLHTLAIRMVVGVRVGELAPPCLHLRDHLVVIARLSFLMLEGPPAGKEHLGPGKRARTQPPLQVLAANKRLRRLLPAPLHRRRPSHGAPTTHAGRLLDPIVAIQSVRVVGGGERNLASDGLGCELLNCPRLALAQLRVLHCKAVVLAVLEHGGVARVCKLAGKRLPQRFVLHPSVPLVHDPGDVPRAHNPVVRNLLLVHHLPPHHEDRLIHRHGLALRALRHPPHPPRLELVLELRQLLDNFPSAP